MAGTTLDRLLASLPDSALVLDVGGWAAPHPRADAVIDIGDWESRGYFHRARGEPAPPSRARRELWVQRDVCAPGLWPYEAKQFDFVICVQTLEDIRDPVKACAELERVGRAGYVETPSAAIELTRGIESPLWCGWRHHRWLVEREGSGLVFLAKPHHVHSPFWPAIRSPRLLLPEAARPLELTWEGELPAREQILVHAHDVDRALEAIVARSSRPDPLGSLRRRSAEQAWRLYRRGRSAAGRAARRRGAGHS